MSKDKTSFVYVTYIGSTPEKVFEAIVTMVSTGLGVSVIPKLGLATQTLPVREIALGRHAPARQISFVCRGADRENRRIAAMRDAFAHAFAG